MTIEIEYQEIDCFIRNYVTIRMFSLCSSVVEYLNGVQEMLVRFQSRGEKELTHLPYAGKFFFGRKFIPALSLRFGVHTWTGLSSP